MKRLLQTTIVLAGLFYLVVLGLRGLVFLLSHVPAASELDPILVAIVAVERVLTSPKRLLRIMWPTQSTPAFLNLALTVLNSLIWGAVLAGLRERLRKWNA